jgi:hypothetical protein
MSLGERVAVLIAIVLGLALAELASSFHRLMRAGKRVRWDWMSPALAVLMLLETIQFWWISQAWYANATDFRLIEFLPRLVILLLIYLLAAAALPDEVPEKGIDLRAYYLESSRYLWTLVLLLTLSIMIFLAPTNAQSSYLGGIARHLVLDGLVVIVAAAALTFRNIRVQQAAVIAILLMVVYAYLASARAFH